MIPEQTSVSAMKSNILSDRSEKQYRHLINEDFVAATEKKFGKITKRCVLYKDETIIEENGVKYKNVEDYLCEL